MKLLTYKEVAAILNCSVGKVRAIPRQELPRIVLGHTTVRINEYDVSKYIYKKTRKS